MKGKQLQIVSFDEEFRQIKGFESYLISSLGNVYSGKRNKLLKPRLSDGYLRVELRHNGKKKSHFIHKLIANAFIPNPDKKPFVNHKDSNRSNNRIENLEWVTASENSMHGWRCGNITGWTGKRHCETTKDRISKSKKGVLLSDEHKLNISNGLLNSRHAKAVIVYDSNTNEIARFASIKEASITLEIRYDKIVNNLRGLIKNADNKIFRYEKSA